MGSMNGKGGGGGISAQCFQSKLQAPPHGFGSPLDPPLTFLHPQLSHRDTSSSLCCTFPNSSEKQLKTLLMGEQTLSTHGPCTGGFPDPSPSRVSAEDKQDTHSLSVGKE